MAPAVRGAESRHPRAARCTGCSAQTQRRKKTTLKIEENVNVHHCCQKPLIKTRPHTQQRREEECPEETTGISVNSGSPTICASPRQTQTLAPRSRSRMNCQVGFFRSTSTVRHQETLCKSYWNNSTQKHALAGKRLGWVTRQLGSVPCSGTLYTTWRPNFAQAPLSCCILQFLRPMSPSPSQDG